VRKRRWGSSVPRWCAPCNCAVLPMSATSGRIFCLARRRDARVGGRGVSLPGSLDQAEIPEIPVQDLCFDERTGDAAAAFLSNTFAVFKSKFDEVAGTKVAPRSGDFQASANGPDVLRFEWPFSGRRVILYSKARRFLRHSALRVAREHSTIATNAP
jgi:hypothetical protein